MYLIMVKRNLILFNPLESEIHLNYIEEGQLETMQTHGKLKPYIYSYNMYNLQHVRVSVGNNFSSQHA